MKTKSILLICLLTVAFSVTNAQVKLKAIGGGLALGSQSAISTSGSTVGFGININGLLQITEEVDGEAAINYYLPSEPVTGLKFHVWTFNLNGHYNFSKSDKMEIYGLAGLNFAFVSNTIDLGPFFGGSQTSSATRIGLNIGLGGDMDFTDNIAGFGQLGYTISDFDQLFANIGILYKFK